MTACIESLQVQHAAVEGPNTPTGLGLLTVRTTAAVSRPCSAEPGTPKSALLPPASCPSAPRPVNMLQALGSR